jgi:hypothetical protein
MVRFVVLGIILICLLSCRKTENKPEPELVQFESLIAAPQKYNGVFICTRGVAVSGFEASGVAAAAHEDEGALQLAEPVIWLESADIRSQTGCFTTSTVPAYEFCHATVCGRFEYGGRYGHLDAYDFQLRGEAGASRSSTTEPLAKPLAAPTPSVFPFRSDQFHVEVSVPLGWVVAEGPIRLTPPFVGLVAINSWGQADFWAPALLEEDGGFY